VSRCALDKRFASISGRWPAPHVREQEMLDDDSGFGEITVEICTRTLPQFRSASGENGAIQTAAARGRCRARRIRDKTANYAVPAGVGVATIRSEFQFRLAKL